MIFLLLFLLSPQDMEDIDLPNWHLKKTQEVKTITRMNVFSKVLMKIIKVYQGSFSLVQGDVCNFIPSCSHFGYDALKQFGLIKGLLLTSDRLQRCHPGAWSYLKNYYSLATDSLRGERLYDPVEKYK